MGSAGHYEGVMLEGIQIINAEGTISHESDLVYHSDTDSYTDSFMVQSLATGLDAETGHQAQHHSILVHNFGVKMDSLTCYKSAIAT